MSDHQKSASMVVGPDKIRSIYEIQNSGQSYKVGFPYTKTKVNVFPVSNADIRVELEKMEIICDGKITLKGTRILATKLQYEILDKKGSNSEKLEEIGIIANYHITPYGLKILKQKMAEDFAMVPNGDLAIDECNDIGELLKIVR